MQSRFRTTRWSLLLQVRAGNAEESRAAWNELCQRYWFPVWCFLRKRGYSREESEDLTQDYFLRLVSKGTLAGVDRERGRLRSFLLRDLQFFLSDHRRMRNASKRGGGVTLTSFDFEVAESGYRKLPAETTTPDRLFDKQWALTILESVFEQLREEFTNNDKEELYVCLKSFMATNHSVKQSTPSGMTPGAFKVAVHRFRRRFHVMLLKQIASTVSHPDELEDEMHYLLSLFSE